MVIKHCKKNISYFFQMLKYEEMCEIIKNKNIRIIALNRGFNNYGEFLILDLMDYECEKVFRYYGVGFSNIIKNYINYFKSESFRKIRLEDLKGESKYVDKDIALEIISNIYKEVCKYTIVKSYTNINIWDDNRCDLIEDLL